MAIKIWREAIIAGVLFAILTAWLDSLPENKVKFGEIQELTKKEE